MINFYFSMKRIEGNNNLAGVFLIFKIYIRTQKLHK